MDTKALNFFALSDSVCALNINEHCERIYTQVASRSNWKQYIAEIFDFLHTYIHSKRDVTESDLPESWSDSSVFPISYVVFTGNAGTGKTYCLAQYGIACPNMLVTSGVRNATETHIKMITDNVPIGSYDYVENSTTIFSSLKIPYHQSKYQKLLERLHRSENIRSYYTKLAGLEDQPGHVVRKAVREHCVNMLNELKELMVVIYRYQSKYCELRRITNTEHPHYLNRLTKEKTGKKMQTQINLENITNQEVYKHYIAGDEKMSRIPFSAIDNMVCFEEDGRTSALYYDIRLLATWTSLLLSNPSFLYEHRIPIHLVTGSTSQSSAIGYHMSVLELLSSSSFLQDPNNYYYTSLFQRRLIDNKDKRKQKAHELLCLTLEGNFTENDYTYMSLLPYEIHPEHVNDPMYLTHCTRLFSRHDQIQQYMRKQRIAGKASTCVHDHVYIAHIFIGNGSVSGRICLDNLSTKTAIEAEEFRLRQWCAKSKLYAKDVSLSHNNERIHDDGHEDMFVFNAEPIITSRRDDMRSVEVEEKREDNMDDDVEEEDMHTMYNTKFYCTPKTPFQFITGRAIDMLSAEEHKEKRQHVLSLQDEVLKDGEQISKGYYDTVKMSHHLDDMLYCPADDIVLEIATPNYNMPWYDFIHSIRSTVKARIVFFKFVRKRHMIPGCSLTVSTPFTTLVIRGFYNCTVDQITKQKLLAGGPNLSSIMKCVFILGIIDNYICYLINNINHHVVDVNNDSREAIRSIYDQCCYGKNVTVDKIVTETDEIVAQIVRAKRSKSRHETIYSSLNKLQTFYSTICAIDENFCMNHRITYYIEKSPLFLPYWYELIKPCSHRNLKINSLTNIRLVACGEHESNGLWASQLSKRHDIITEESRALRKGLQMKLKTIFSMCTQNYTKDIIDSMITAHVNDTYLVSNVEMNVANNIAWRSLLTQETEKKYGIMLRYGMPHTSKDDKDGDIFSPYEQDLMNMPMSFSCINQYSDIIFVQSKEVIPISLTHQLADDKKRNKKKAIENNVLFTRLNPFLTIPAFTKDASQGLTFRDGIVAQIDKSNNAGTLVTITRPTNVDDIHVSLVSHKRNKPVKRLLTAEQRHKRNKQAINIRTR